MAENYDDLITRLRNHHGLDLTDVETENDLREKLKNLTSRSGSRIKSIHQNVMNQRLISNVSELFDTENVQGAIGPIFQVRKDLNEAEFYETVQDIDVSERLSNAEVSSRKIDELNNLKANRASILARQEKIIGRAESFLNASSTEDIPAFRYYRQTSAIANRYNLDEEDVIEKLRELNVEVDDTGRIL